MEGIDRPVYGTNPPKIVFVSSCPRVSRPFFDPISPGKILLQCIGTSYLTIPGDFYGSTPAIESGS
jgi:hypothetical protein